MTRRPLALRAIRLAVGGAVWCGVLSAVWGAAALADSVPAGAGISIDSGALRVEVTALTDDIVRVRIARAGEHPEDASWAVPSAMRGRSVSITPELKAGATEFHTASLAVRIESAPLRLIVSDLAGHVISADAPDAVDLAVNGFTLRKALPQSEHYFGLGDKPGPLDRRGQAFTNWNTDAYHFQESTDPIYKTIPFFVAAGGPGGSYGLLLDNTWRTWFDFGKRVPGTLSMGSAGGAIDYYLIHGPSVKQVVERYAALTGTPPLPPAWAFGYQQSRYSYMSAAEVEGVGSRLRAEHIPADVIWLDIDFQDRNRPFTTNPTTYPDLPLLAAHLREWGMRLVAITDMHIAAAADQGYAPFDSGVAGDHFIKQADGSLYVGEVWPGPSVFPDFTRSVTRDWWGTLYRNFLGAGVAGFWNDMNEPSIFGVPSKTMPLDNQHRIAEAGFAPRTATHAEIHNVYGMQNSRATFDGLTRLQPDERPFVLTRATYAGGQRYAATWTGDNSSTWAHLKLSIPMLLNLGLSGFAYSGTDVGGFIGTPTPELLTRWIEIAAFTPLLRVHSEKGALPKEPWVHGPTHTGIRRRYIEQRYKLMPYFYALADETSRSGAPLMRPLFYEFPETLESPCDYSSDFMLGERLLIAAPPDLESPGQYTLCLPAGHWYDFWTGRPVVSAQVSLTPALDRLPVFVRAGAILPSQPLVQSTSDTPRGPLVLDVYPGEDCRGTLYADDGHSLGYQRQNFWRQQLRCTFSDAGLSLDFDAGEGTFKPWWRMLKVRVHGWHGGAAADLDGRSLRGVIAAKGTLQIDMDAPTGMAHLTVNRVH